jgi:hypothetical protein
MTKQASKNYEFSLNAVKAFVALNLIEVKPFEPAGALSISGFFVA